MKTTILLSFLLSLAFTASATDQKIAPTETRLPSQIVLDADVLADKIKGAWAGQTIGVSYGFPTEFKYNSTMVPDIRRLDWYDGYMKKIYELFPGVYDDIYMDLTFVQVIEDQGYDAPAQAYADAFAYADFVLMHANQTARHNIINGLAPPDSGHWLNNPTADDIDFQIEADFAGIMHPGMPNSAARFTDDVGHIMNYGDGWYGGVYVAALYSLAFVSDDVEFVVTEALKTIPEKSLFHQTITDTIDAYRAYPDDWRQAWFAIHRKWGHKDKGPDGAFDAYNIDAKVNSAWVVLGLLYGDGDFTRTVEIATRAGDDSDCNPSTAAGVLGAMLGYDKIPEHWKQGLAEVEGIDFAYTTISLNDAYKLSYKHALDAVVRRGGKVDANTVTINVESPEPVRYEQSFEGHYPVEKIVLSEPSGALKTVIKDSYKAEFTGIGFVLRGRASSLNGQNYTFKADLYVDGKKVANTTLPTDMNTRKFHIFWAFELDNGRHDIEVKILNPTDEAQILLHDLVVYGPEELSVSY